MTGPFCGSHHLLGGDVEVGDSQNLSQRSDLKEPRHGVPATGERSQRLRKGDLALAWDHYVARGKAS